MSWQNPVVGGSNLRIPAIQSPNFIESLDGWQINQDGSAFFTNLNVTNTVVTGGSIILTQAGDGVFVYNGAPAAGNLILSIAANAGSDTFGNVYPAGIQIYAGFGEIDGSTLNAGTVAGGALINNTVTAAQIADQTITATELANDAVGASQLAAGSVYTGAIQTGAVTTNAIAANAIVAGLIAAGAIDAMAINVGTLTVQGSQGQLLVYNGTAANGTLFISLAPQAGIDQFGNSYPAGIAITNNGTIQGADTIIQPNQGALLGYSQ